MSSRQEQQQQQQGPVAASAAVVWPGCGGGGCVFSDVSRLQPVVLGLQLCPLGSLGCVGSGSASDAQQQRVCRVALPVDVAESARVCEAGAVRSAMVQWAGLFVCVCWCIVYVCKDQTAGSPVTAAYRSGFGCGLLYWGVGVFPGTPAAAVDVRSRGSMCHSQLVWAVLCAAEPQL